MILLLRRPISMRGGGGGEEEEGKGRVEGTKERAGKGEKREL